MKNIHILPTDKPSRLFEILQFNFVFDNQNKYSEEYKKLHSYKNQNIYITSDEEIKEGDCFLPQGHINPHKLKEYNKINGDLESYNGLCYDISKCKKIILTTDADLIKEGVQAIDDEFLEWFVKNPSCERVEVRKIEDELISPKNPKIRFNALQDPPSFISAESLNNMILTYKYKIIIPKEEAKKVGEYQQELFSYLHDLGVTALQSEMQEIERIVLDMQQEQDKKLYSEEEVKKITEQTIEKFYKHIYADKTKAEMKELWFEQVKKK